MAFINIGGRYPVMRSRPVLRFRQRGTTFPDSYYPAHTPTQVTSYIDIMSSAPNTVTIDYGDGTTQSYVFGEVQSGTYRFRMEHMGDGAGSSWDYPYHQYAGTTGDEHRSLPEHLVTLTFASPDAITNFTTILVPIYGIFPSAIGKMNGLERLVLNSTAQITDFPAAFGTSTSITSLTVQNIGPAIESRIPDEFLALPLQGLNVDQSVNLSDAESSNFSNIDRLKDTLTSLQISRCDIAVCPPELEELINLVTLNIQGNVFSECPPEINSLINLETLYFAYVNNNLTGWGDFSACTKLKFIYIQSNINGGLTTELPVWLNQLTAFKNCICYGSFGQNQARTDDFVDNVYDFIATNAPMTGVSTDPFRNMNFNMSIQPSHLHYPFTKRPSGTYQQPTGYVQGSSNGTPASPMEKIWVMTNQYNHTWSVIA